MKASMRKTIRAENGWQWLWGLVKECISIFTHSRCKLFHLNFLNTILCFDLILMGLQIRKHKHGLERQIASLIYALLDSWEEKRKLKRKKRTWSSLRKDQFYAELRLYKNDEKYPYQTWMWIQYSCLYYLMHSSFQIKIETSLFWSLCCLYSYSFIYIHAFSLV